MIGTSLLVPPVNLIPGKISNGQRPTEYLSSALKLTAIRDRGLAELGHVPQILINRDAVKVMNPTVRLCSYLHVVGVLISC